MTEFQKKTSFATGEVIFRQGDPSTDIYHIHSGRVGISIPGGTDSVILAELGPGALFGEMALIIGPPRTATATAMEPVILNIIPEALFREKTFGLPEWSLSIAKVLAERLKNTTSSLDRLLYQKSHSAEFGADDVSNGLNIVPHTLEISYYPNSDIGRLYLSGVLDASGLDDLLNRINSLRRQHISPIIVSFSNVIDVNRRAFESLVELARTSTDATGLIKLENVQFIADHVQMNEGFHDILHSPQAPIKRIGYGDTLIRQGDSGTEMYVVKTGSFTVFRTVGEKEVVLWTAGEGDVIGEMALISGKVRSASVRANKSSQVYVIDLLEFRKNAYHIPRWFMGIIESLVNRLRNTDKLLDNFVKGELQGVDLADLMNLEIFENTKVPGFARLYGALTGGTLKDLRLYLGPRLRKGIRQFQLDVTQIRSFDQVALKFLVRFHKHLLNIRGKLMIIGSKRLQIPLEL